MCELCYYPNSNTIFSRCLPTYLRRRSCAPQQIHRVSGRADGRTDAVVELFGLVPSLRYRLLARQGRRRRRLRLSPSPSSPGGSSRVVPRSNAAKKVERGAALPDQFLS